MLRFQPVDALTTLREKLLFDEPDAWNKCSGATCTTGGVLPIAAGAGDCLDIELNVSWPQGQAVPTDFGSIGLAVLGSVGVIDAATMPSHAEAAALPQQALASVATARETTVYNFSIAKTDHGSDVSVTDGTLGRCVSPAPEHLALTTRELLVYSHTYLPVPYQPTDRCLSSGASWASSSSSSCNQVAFLETPGTFLRHARLN
jgi:hypothetical protein